MSNDVQTMQALIQMSERTSRLQAVTEMVLEQLARLADELDALQDELKSQ